MDSLISEAERINTQNDILSEINRKKRFDEMSNDLDETIKYLNECNESELLWATEVLEDLSEHFRSQDLIDCVEKNHTRCSDREIRNQLKMTLEYMKKYV